MTDESKDILSGMVYRCFNEIRSGKAMIPLLLLLVSLVNAAYERGLKDAHIQG